MGVCVKKGNESLSFYRIISNEVRKSIYQGVPGKRNDGEGKGLPPPDVGFHLLRTKKDWEKVSGWVDLEWMFRTDSSLVL